MRFSPSRAAWIKSLSLLAALLVTIVTVQPAPAHTAPSCAPLDIISGVMLSGTAATFEADSIAAELPAEAARLAAVLEAWAATLDPIPPNTMSSHSQHLGCFAYAYPTSSGGASAGASYDTSTNIFGAAAQHRAIHAAAELDPYMV